MLLRVPVLLRSTYATCLIRSGGIKISSSFTIARGYASVASDETRARTRSTGQPLVGHSSRASQLRRLEKGVVTREEL